MKIRFFMIVLLCGADALGEDLGFRYSSETHQCERGGVYGINPNEYLGECGSIEYAHLFWANLQRRNLKGIHLRGADLRSARLRGSNLEGAVFSRANLDGASLEGCRLIRSSFFRADMEQVNLRSAVLENASLSGAVLTYADLRGTSLLNADLSGADLRQADLSSANFRGADLSRADLRTSLLEGADFTDAIFNDQTRLPFSREEAERRGMIYRRFSRQGCGRTSQNPGTGEIQRLGQTLSAGELRPQGIVVYRLEIFFAETEGPGD